MSLDDLISESSFIKNDELIIKTIHTKESYKTLVKETSSFFQRNIIRISVLIIIPIIFLLIEGFSFPEYIIFLVFYVLFIVPIIIYGSIFLETKKS